MQTSRQTPGDTSPEHPSLEGSLRQALGKSKEELLSEMKLMLSQSTPSWLPDEPLDPSNPELWLAVTEGIVEGEDWKALISVLAELGPPMACFGITPQEVIAHLQANERWSKVEENSKTARVARIVAYRVSQLKERFSSRKVDRSQQIHLQEVPKLDPNDWAGSLGRLVRWMGTNGIGPEKWLEVSRKALPDSLDKAKLTSIKKTQDPRELKQQIAHAISPHLSMVHFEGNLHGLRPKIGETMNDYSLRFKDHLELTRFGPEAAGEIFRKGLPSFFNDKIHIRGNLATLEDILQFLHEGQDPIVTTYVRPPRMHNSKTPGWEGKGDSQPKIKTTTCAHCGKFGHHESVCRTRIRESQEGVKFKKPRYTRESDKQPVYSRTAANDQWPKKDKTLLASLLLSTKEEDEADATEALRTWEKGQLIFKQVTLQNSVSKHALIDTGSQNSLISQDTWEEVQKISGTIPSKFRTVTVTYANGEEEQGRVIPLEVSWQDHHKIHPFILIPSLVHPVIIGMDVLNSWQMLLQPTVSVEGMRARLKEFELPGPHEILDIPLSVELHPQHAQLMEQLEEQIKNNMATGNEHSTIGEVAIEFKDPKMRQLGIWRQQVSLDRTASAFYQDQVNGWLKEGVVEEMCDLPEFEVPDTGHFNTNGFPIHSGKPRIVHNFKPINDAIRDETNDLPSINVMFEKIAQSGARIYSKLDLRCAYLQVPLRAKDKSICAFTCNGKRYRFATAPLGLKIIPARFQRWIQALLQRSNCTSFACNYLDDIILFSKAEEEHQHHVKQVLEALTSVKLTIQPKKCVFFATRLPVLGFWLQIGGLQPNFDKLCNMMHWPRPNTRKKLESLLGVLNFFRRFIPNATEEMYALMSIKKKKFEWDKQPGAELAYRRLFTILVKNGPFLWYPIQDVVVELATDASEYGIGAILFQVINNEVKYLGFNSRVLKEAERRYSTPKKELISILFHVKYYRDILLGKPFKLHTDAEALTLVLKNLDRPKKNTVLAGWLADLSQFTFSVHHVKGKNNTLPDMASRICSIGVAATGSKKVLTEEAVTQLLKHTHGLAHWGATNMYKHVRYTLGIDSVNNLFKKCQEFTKNCGACLRVNSYRVAFSPPREPVLWLPMQYVHIDLMEMPESEQGYRYILVVLDQMSGFVLLKALLTKEMAEVSEDILDIFLTFGFPEAIKSDNGSEFCNKMVTELLSKANVRHNRIIAHNHHENGSVERVIRSVRDTLEKFIRSMDEQKYRKSWEELVPLVQFGLNNRTHRVTQSTPFSLMFGRTAFQFKTKTAGIEESQKALSEFWTTFNREIPDAVLKMRQLEHEGQKYAHKTGTFKIGDHVMCKIQRMNKSDDRYQGPFVITNTLKNGHYTIRRGEEVMEAPANFLKIAAPFPNLHAAHQVAKTQFETNRINKDHNSTVDPNESDDPTLLNSHNKIGTLIKGVNTHSHTARACVAEPSQQKQRPRRTLKPVDYVILDNGKN